MHLQTQLAITIQKVLKKEKELEDLQKQIDTLKETQETSIVELEAVNKCIDLAEGAIAFSRRKITKKAFDEKSEVLKKILGI